MPKERDNRYAGRIGNPAQGLKAALSIAKILIVESELPVGREMTAILEDLGYEVSAITATGEGAIQKAGRFKPGLILMDIVLPGRFLFPEF